MSLTLRVILIVCSILAFILVVRKIKQSKLKVKDCIIWIIGSILLIFMSIFSNVVTWVSEQLGFMAPVNFVFFVMIVFLLVEAITKKRIPQEKEALVNLKGIGLLFLLMFVIMFNDIRKLFM